MFATRRLFRLTMAVWGLLLLGAAAAMASQQFKPVEVKAACLYNLTNFIKWPPEAFTPPPKVFRLAVLGEDPFGSFLDQIIGGERVHGKYPIQIDRISELSDLDSYHMLFISDSAKYQWQQIFELIGNRPVLTVSDVNKFVHNGGMINLVARGSRIRIEINPVLLRQRGFTVSAKLLKLSTIVEP